MSYTMKVEPFTEKDKEIDLCKQNCKKDGDNDVSIRKMILVALTIASAIVITGMFSLTIYYVVFPHGKTTPKSPFSDMKMKKLTSGAYQILVNPSTKNLDKIMYPSKISLTQAKKIALESSTIRLMEGDRVKLSSKPDEFEKNNSSIISDEDVSQLQENLMKTKAMELDSIPTTKQPIHQGCLKYCPKIYRPVCGTDDNTYSNHCMLNVSACTTGNKNLDMAYEGSCRSSFNIDACCPQLIINTQTAQNFFAHVGRYKVHSWLNERPVYKSLRRNYYLFWWAKIDGAVPGWGVAREINGTLLNAYNPVCRQKCAHDCPSKDWLIYDGREWVNDYTFSVECNRNAGTDVDPCKENKPLELFDSNAGEILFPNSLNQDQGFIECEWRINVQKEHIVKLKIFELDLADASDFINIYDGESMSALRIGYFRQNSSHNKSYLFSTGSDMYISFVRYPNVRSSQFKIRYHGEKCDWNAWKNGSCSKTCGGGKQTKMRTLRNLEQSTANCGPSSLTETCNVHSCNEPTCKELEMMSRQLFSNSISGIFKLHTLIVNDRAVYFNEYYKYYLYSSKTPTKETNGLWLVGSTPGSGTAFAANLACKDSETPQNCKYDWYVVWKGETVLDQNVTISCKSFM